MTLKYSFCLLLVIILVSEIQSRTTPAKDSFEESFEDSTNISPELEEALKPAEDAILGFVNKLVNTGYLSSKITLNRIEKANQKRKELGKKVQDMLAILPNYNLKVPIVDDVPRVFKSPQ